MEVYNLIMKDRLELDLALIIPSLLWCYHGNLDRQFRYIMDIVKFPLLNNI